MKRAYYYIFCLCFIANIVFSEGETTIENVLTLDFEKFITNSTGKMHAWIKCTYSSQREILVNRRDFFIRQHLEGDKSFHSNGVHVVNKINVVDVSFGVKTRTKYEWIYLDAGDAVTFRMSVPFESINMVNKATLRGEYLCKQPDPLEKVPVLKNKIVSPPLILYYINRVWSTNSTDVK